MHVSTKAIPTADRNGFCCAISCQLIFCGPLSYLTSKRRV